MNKKLFDILINRTIDFNNRREYKIENMVKVTTQKGEFKYSKLQWHMSWWLVWALGVALGFLIAKMV
jgi:hypothetical protein